MTYYNERRTVEAMVLPFAFASVARTGLPDVPEREEIALMFEDAAKEIMPRLLTPKQSGRLYSRIREIILNCITHPAQRYQYPAAKVALVLYYFMANMIDQNAYAIFKDSFFSKALDKFLPTVEPWLEQERFDKSAFREARRLLTRMHEHGYFRDVEWRYDFKGGET